MLPTCWFLLTMVSCVIAVTISDDAGTTPQKYKAEVLVVMDYPLVQRYMGFGYSEAEARKTLREEVIYYIKEMKEMYRSMSQYNLDIDIFPTTTVLMNATQSMVEPKDVLLSDRVPGGTLLKRCSAWLRKNQYHTKYNYDVALLYTGYHLAKSRDPKKGRVKGMAFSRKACNSKYNCVAVDNDGTYGSAVYAMAHELAHSLGAPHDKDTNCTSAGRHIMSSKYSGSGRWTFSECSVKSIKKHMNKLGSKNCLLTTNPKSEEFKPPAVIPADIGNPDKLCKRAYGKNAKNCSFKSPNCSRIFCEKSKPVKGKRVCYSMLSSDMMSCSGGHCNEGKCVKSHFGYATDTHQVVPVRSKSRSGDSTIE